MSQKTREDFWSWYVRSARSDGASVSAFRRILNLLTTFGLLLGWYIWTTKSNPLVGKILSKVTAVHPVFIGGIVLAFAAMGFRVTALDYMAYSIYEIGHVKFPRGIFGNEGNLRRKYEQIFGRDSFRRVPEICGALSMLLMFVSGLGLVFATPPPAR